MYRMDSNTVHLFRLFITEPGEGGADMIQTASFSIAAHAVGDA